MKKYNKIYKSAELIILSAEESEKIAGVQA